MDVGIIQHQMMHALGFYHETSRIDRKNHVEVKIEHVVKGKIKNKITDFFLVPALK